MVGSLSHDACTKHFFLMIPRLILILPRWTGIIGLGSRELLHRMATKILVESAGTTDNRDLSALLTFAHT
jgi:hypothetical protein